MRSPRSWTITRPLALCTSRITISAGYIISPCDARNGSGRHRSRVELPGTAQLRGTVRMRLLFWFIPMRFALLSCAIYLGLVVALGVVGVLVAVLGAKIFGGFVIGGYRWFWLAINAGVFF